MKYLQTTTIHNRLKIKELSLGNRGERTPEMTMR